MSKPLLLVYGRDRHLLESRALVLESAGFEVRNTMDQLEADRILASQAVTVLILCHTLSFAESQTILKSAHSLEPGRRTLVLGSDGSGCIVSGQDLMLGGFSGPITLIQAVREAMARPMAVN